MKFKVGDVVRYTNKESLVPEFLTEWGLGPFIVTKVGDYGLISCTTMEGTPVTMPGGRTLWGFGTSNMILDKFLTATHKAIKSKETHVKRSKTRKTTKSAARRGRAA